jgi:hypothetical protein
MVTNARPRIQDHRPQTERPIVRDQRSPEMGTPPIVRDNRTQPPIVRDHRGDVHIHVHTSPGYRPAPSIDRGAAARSEFDAIMGDRNLSLEDKIMTLLFKVMKSMDQELLDKANKINQSRKDAPGANGSKNSGSGANGTEAADTQLQELQQLQFRRNTMFGMLTAIVAKFDESASKVTQRMGQ